MGNLPKIPGGTVKPCRTCGAEFISRHSDLCLSCMLARPISETLPDLQPQEAPPVHASAGKPRAKKSKNRPGAEHQARLARQRNAERLAQWLADHPGAAFNAPAPLPVQLPRIVPPEAPRHGLVCPLCGARLVPGDVLAHKAQAHGELQVTPSPPTRRGRSGWVSMCQGGLPSLGKGSR
jgi:hypothetical protein